MASHFLQTKVVLRIYKVAHPNGWRTVQNKYILPITGGMYVNKMMRSYQKSKGEEGLTLHIICNIVWFYIFIISLHVFYLQINMQNG